VAPITELVVPVAEVSDDGWAAKRPPMAMAATIHTAARRMRMRFGRVAVVATGRGLRFIRSWLLLAKLGLSGGVPLPR
jgi:hypothetical protein